MHPSAPTSPRLRAGAAVLAFLAVSLLVIRSSQAAFVSQDANTGNAFEAATIGLDVTASAPLFGYDGTALVDTSDLAPGDVRTGCLDVVYTGTLTGAALETVTLAASGAVGDLGPALRVDVDVQSGTCATSSFDTADISWNAAAGTADTDTGWRPATSGETYAFHVAVTFESQGDAGDVALMGAIADDVDLVWTVRSA
jgi:hypothetical protein